MEWLPRLVRAVCFVFVGPPMFLWLPLFVLVLIAVFFTRRLALIRSVLAAFFVGLFVPGVPLAQKLADDAIAAHRCPDAGWAGPALGGMIGAGVGLVLWLLWCVARPPTRAPDFR